MKRTRQARAIVLGAGPAGLVSALELSKHYPTTLIARRFSSREDATRIEAVPAALLAFLVELGIPPHEVEIDCLHDSRRIAWDQEAPIENRSPAAAHVDRAVLDAALLRRVRASKRIRVVFPAPRFIDYALQAAKRDNLFLIDATGRKSISAQNTIHPAKPWAARTFLAQRRSSKEDPAMSIAALPEGFVYRLGSSRHVVLGITGRNTAVAGTPSDLQHRLLEAGAAWILDGLPPLAKMIPGKASVASVQWSTGGVGFRVGDAALARDSISSQGLAAGISDALYGASAIRNGDDLALLLQRQAEQRQAHLSSLGQTIANCRFRHERTWREYSEFIAQHLASEPVASRVALRAGRMAAVTTQRAETLSPM
jgi:2-polyprenyl-6-methoxyphenol hydroxylase-like FAD-dependent oxidoreductase